MVTKNNKYVAKRKKQLAKLCAFIESLLSPYLKSFIVLLSCSLPAPVPALMPALVPTHIPVINSRLRSPTILSSRYIPTHAASAPFS